MRAVSDGSCLTPPRAPDPHTHTKHKQKQKQQVLKTHVRRIFCFVFVSGVPLYFVHVCVCVHVFLFLSSRGTSRCAHLTRHSVLSHIVFAASSERRCASESGHQSSEHWMYDCQAEHYLSARPDAHSLRQRGRDFSSFSPTRVQQRVMTTENR